MKRTVIDNGTVIKWHNSKEELPNLKNKEDNIMCLTLEDGMLRLNVWNQYYLCWDDAEGDDYQFAKEHEFLWCPLETMSEDEIIEL